MAVFENLLPDNDDIRKRVAEKVGAEGIDAYSMLAQIGRDCVGAMQFLPEGEEPKSQNGLTGNTLTETQVEALLNDLERNPLPLHRTFFFFRGFKTRIPDVAEHIKGHGE